jgi:CDP-diacylglycerol--serine O-phosphatidyltransferase
VETDDEDSHDVFSGLPSPAAAGVIASFPVAMFGLGNLTEPDAKVSEFAQRLATWLEPVLLEVLPLITLAVACLMVSRVRYSHVFNQLFSGKRSRGHLIQIVFTGAVVFSVREMAVPLIFCYFAFASPCRALWQSVISPKTQEQSSIL